jgi:N-acetylneuraminate synthase
MKSNFIDKIKNKEFVLIAEIGVNYYDIAKKKNISPLDAAMLMIDGAKKAGVHAVKFQTYKAEKLAARDSPFYWDISEEPTPSQYELFKKFDMFGKEEYEFLNKYCQSVEIDFFSTPFDFESVDYLDEIMDVYKISSSDLNNLPFIEYIAKKKKPILLSTGASNEDEIDEAVMLIKKHNDNILVIMHCVLEYPTLYEHANLNKILTLKKRYDELIVGYSDHTKPDTSLDIIKTAYNLGATVIEKHFTLDKSLKGNDHYHAMDVTDAKNIITAIKFIDKIRGTYDLFSLENEQIARQNARRSIVSKGIIKKGEYLTKDNLIFKRPGTGIIPKKLSQIIGKKLKFDIPDDTILSFDMLE